jgi:hypothetical protein
MHYCYIFFLLLVQQSRLTVIAAAKVASGKFRAHLSARSRTSIEVFENENLEISDEVPAISTAARAPALSGVPCRVRGMMHIHVQTAVDVWKVLQAAQAMRQTSATPGHNVSSRSHTIFTATLVRPLPAAASVCSTLTLVDLAGSESAGKGVEGQRLKEACHINSSLMSLGKVVTALEAPGGGGHVPFRDSKLTRLLRVRMGHHLPELFWFQLVPACMHTFLECKLLSCPFVAVL